MGLGAKLLPAPSLKGLGLMPNNVRLVISNASCDN